MPGQDGIGIIIGVEEAGVRLEAGVSREQLFVAVPVFGHTLEEVLIEEIDVGRDGDVVG